MAPPAEGLASPEYTILVWSETKSGNSKFTDSDMAKNKEEHTMRMIKEIWCSGDKEVEEEGLMIKQKRRE